MNELLTPFDFTHPKYRDEYLDIGTHCQYVDMTSIKETAKTLAPVFISIDLIQEEHRERNRERFEGWKLKIPTADYNKVFLSTVLIQAVLSVFFSPTERVLSWETINSLLLHSDKGKALIDAVIQEYREMGIFKSKEVVTKKVINLNLKK